MRRVVKAYQKHEIAMCFLIIRLCLVVMFCQYGSHHQKQVQAPRQCFEAVSVGLSGDQVTESEHLASAQGHSVLHRRGCRRCDLDKVQVRRNVEILAQYLTTLELVGDHRNPLPNTTRYFTELSGILWFPP